MITWSNSRLSSSGKILSKNNLTELRCTRATLQQSDWAHSYLTGAPVSRYHRKQCTSSHFNVAKLFYDVLGNLNSLYFTWFTVLISLYLSIQGGEGRRTGGREPRIQSSNLFILVYIQPYKDTYSSKGCGSLGVGGGVTFIRGGGA